MSAYTASRVHRSHPPVRQPSRLLFVVGLMGAFLSQRHDAVGASASPFASFAGAWRGTGQVVGANGGVERLRCRATYSISDSGDALSQTLVCASDSYQVKITSYLVARGQGVQGYWEEATRQVKGQVSGAIKPGRFDGSVVGPGFTAALTLRAEGRGQIVDIRPSVGDVADARITMTRES